MSYVACLLAFGLYWVANTKMPSKLSSVPGVNFVPFALLAIGTMTLADTAVGTYTASWVIEPVLGWLGGFISVSAAILAAAAFVIVAIAAICDLADLNPEGIAKTAVMVLPFLALVAVGPFAAQGSGLFDAVSNSGTDALMNFIGR